MPVKKLGFGDSWFWKSVLLATLISLPFLALNLAILQHKSAYNSDGVDQQLILANWSNGQPLNALLGQDTFIIKYPLYTLIGAVLPHSPTALLVTASVLIVLMLFLFNVFQFLIHKSRGFGVLLSVYLASFGGYVLFCLRLANLRNIELGLGLLTALFGALYFGGHLKKSRLVLALLVLACALQTLSDPYFLYIFLVPMSLSLLIINKKRWQTFKNQLWFLASVVILWKIGVKLLAQAGLHEFSEKLAVPIHSFGNSLKYAGQGLIYIFGDKQLSGETITASAILVIVTGGVTALAVVAYRRRKEPTQPRYLQEWALIYGALVIIINFSAYALSGFVLESANHRYLIGSIAGLGALLAGLSIYKVPRKLISVLLIFLIIAFTGLNLNWARRTPNVDMLSDEKVMTTFANQHNVHLGFADYWSANINTYYANGQATVLPVICQPGTFAQYHFVTNEANFIPDQQLSHRSFFVFINNIRPKYYGTASCSVKDVEKIFPGRSQPYKIDSHRSIVLVR